MKQYESNTDAEIFVQQIKHKNLPIDPHDASVFAQRIVAWRPPKGFLDRVADSLDYLDKKSFEQGLDTMALRKKAIIGSRPYTGLVIGEKDSMMWMQNNMKARGVPPPRHLINLADYPNTERASRGWFDRQAALRSIIVMIDDFSISGALIRDGCLDAYDTSRYETHVLLLAATQKATRIISNEKNVHLEVCNRRIYTLDEQLSTDDCNFIQDVSTVYVGWEDAKIDTKSSALFWAWHKAPDNLPKFFTGDLGIPPLIRPENFPRQY